MLVLLLDALNWNEFKNSVFDENASKSMSLTNSLL